MSLSNRSTETSDALHTISVFTGPPIMYNSQIQTERALNSAQRYSMTSVSSSGRRSSSSLEGSARGTQNRPSGIPRSTSAISQARLKALASSRAAPVHTATMKTSSVESAIPVMHRYPIVNTNTALRPDSAQPPVQQAGHRSRRTTISRLDTAKDTVLGVALPPRQVMPPATDLPPRLIPELQALAATTHHPRVVTGSTSTVSSPSTQFTNSPSPWSASTAATTPISWSSASPSMTQPARAPIFGKRSHTVPVPAITRTRLPEMPIVRENRSVSKSLARANTSTEAVTPPRKVKRTPVNSPAPTPPPRSSSIKRMGSQSSSKSEDHIPPASDTSPPPLPRNASAYLSQDRRINIQSKEAQEPPMSNLTGHHNTLQRALNSAPIRKLPSGVEELQSTQQQHRHAPTPDTESRQLLASALIGPAPQPSQSARSRLAKFSRMALFGRAGKGSEPEVEPDAKPQSRKLQRKGPVAGTGHEGYGKYTRRGRRTSTGGSTTGTDSEGSVVSTTRKPMHPISQKGSMAGSKRDRRSQSDLDDFAASRLKPVVIVGGTKKSELSVHDFGDRDVNVTSTGRVSVESIATRTETGVVSTRSNEPFSTHLEDAGLIDDKAKSPVAQRYPSSGYETLNHDRLSRSTSIPISPNQPYLDSRNTSQSSIAPSSLAAADLSSSFRHVTPKSLENQRKKSRKLRWNIFKKKEYETQDGRVYPGSPPQVIAPELMVNVSTIPASRPMPYYAVLENESDLNNTVAVSDYLTEAAELTDIEDTIDDDDSHVSSMKVTQYGDRKYVESLLLPSAPQFKRNIEPSRTTGQLDAVRTVKEPHDVVGAQTAPTQRQPRLAQIGRIPKVVPTSQAKQPIRTSFSRPFQQIEVNKSDKSYDSGAEPLQYSSRPALEVRTDILPNHPFFSPDSTKQAIAPPHLGTAMQTKSTDQLSVTDHFRFNDRQSTTSTSSDGMISVMAPPLLPSADVANPAFRRTYMEEDVWNEYDDFIDHVTSPQNLDKTDHKINKGNQITTTGPLGGSSKTTSKPPILAKGLAIDTSFSPAPVIYVASDVLQESESTDEVRLRRSRIVSALHSSMDPSSPFSIADYLAEHRNSTRLSGSTTSNVGYSSPKFAFPESLPNISGIQHYENAAHIDEVQRTKNPIRHSELSYTSLMVSRWLSFGRVLFSPAHVDIQKQPERHILVIDGLGSDDWSMYCAVTYQAEQAYVYEVKETGQPSTSLSSKGPKGAPPNLRMREVTSFYDPLKFPDNFFAAVVLRFPPVMAESKLRNLFSECRRVLVPGGYMELTVLDLDIVNMGMHTRRAMRDLKTKISVADPGVSLRPVIDNCQTVLGEHGFSKLSKCVVGVPVVGKPPGISESPVSSRSSGGSDKQHFSPNAGPRPLEGLHEQTSHNFSLNDLVADHSDTADAKISKMVSRTARSWWQHCFETAVISDGNLGRSILADKQVLNECKARASSFKLLIAYAQKPSHTARDMKRRTMSEPTMATLAAA